MKRTFGIIFAIILPATILVTVLLMTSQTGIPSGVQVELDKYLQYQSVTSPQSQAFTVSQIRQIALPWNFTSQMSAGSFGDSPYYQTEHNYQYDASKQSTPIVNIETEQVVSSDVMSRLPLPFPPLDGWCVLLTRDDQEQSRVVYVLLHQDLYTADWIVHEARSNVADEKLRADLIGVGCELDIP